MSSRRASGSKSLPVTDQGVVKPNASCSRLVSRIAVPPRSPDLPEAGAVLAAVKDAARRASARWPAAILDGGCARRPGVVRPGRRNGPLQPNQETAARWVAPAVPARATVPLSTPNSEEAVSSTRDVRYSGADFR